MDAAVATAYALSVVEPFSAGLGGGGFLLYFDAKTKKVTVVDYREVAPKRAHRDMYLDKNGKVDPDRSLTGILAVAVPGMVPGLFEAQKKLGRLKLQEVLDPAIELAKDGFIVPPGFHDASSDRLEALQKHNANVFLKDGQPYAVGDRLVQAELAKTLQALKKQGPRLFTHGRVAKAIARHSKKLGGLLTLDDLKRFKPRFREALWGAYRGYRVATMPPPSSGGTHLLQMLKMLELDRAKRQPSPTQDVHVLMEIMRRAYADRATFMGDPKFVSIPLSGLLSESYLLQRYLTIKPFSASRSASIKAGAPAPHEPNDTTHLSVIDAEGNAVALTQTINYTFGSCVVVPGTGIVLNDEMDDFAAAPGAPNIYGLVGSEANSVQPGKIPLSSMTPTILIKDGKARLAVGSPGGSTIITTTLQVILNVLDKGMNVQDAVAAPRLHMQWLPDATLIEPDALPAQRKRALLNLGHRFKDRSSWGNATAVWVDENGLRTGAADPRGDGAALAQPNVAKR